MYYLFSRGLDFRPEYQNVGILRSFFHEEKVPFLALTATIDPKIYNNICGALNFTENNSICIAKLPDRYKISNVILNRNFN